jgi:hypothetical protein
VHPNVQDAEAQASPDTWIMEIWTYLKDNILPDDMTSADQITRLAEIHIGRSGSLPAWRQWCPNAVHHPGGRLQATHRSSWR